MHWVITICQELLEVLCLYYVIVLIGPYEIDVITIIVILRMQKLKHIKVKWLVQGQVADSGTPSWNSVLCSHLQSAWS